jgi:uncharacterized protein (TIGR02284 family)
METKEKIIKALNDLLTRNYDAEKGFEQAADNAMDPNLVTFFKTYTEQRYRFGHDIKGEIVAIGGEIDKGSSVAGDLHRAWIDIKTALTKKNDKAVIEECIRGENKALSDYQDILDMEELPYSTKTILESHMSKIREAVGQLEELDKVYENEVAVES